MKQGEMIVTVDCITHVYPDMTKVQICGLDFIVNQGERVGILGANGCGKTTLLRHLLGVLIPKDGSVRAHREWAAHAGGGHRVGAAT